MRCTAVQSLLYNLIFVPPDEFVSGIPISFDGYVRTGRSAYYSGDTDDDNLYNTEIYTKAISDEIGPSRHFSILFTVFVFLQIVNEWNCRKLYDEVNIFAGIQNNWISIIVRIVETAIQVVISQFGNRVFSIYPEGLTWYQWLISIAFSLGSLLMRLVLILIPDTIMGSYGISKVTTDQPVIKRRSSQMRKRASLPANAVIPIIAPGNN